MKTITARELEQLIKNNECTLLDVREPVEHAEAHLPQAVLIPLSELPRRISELDRSKPIVVMCHGGKRGAAACEQLLQAGVTNVSNLSGGITAWKEAGLPCASAEKKVMPLMRQVQITVGALVLTSSLLAWFVDTRWIFAAMFFGAGLLFAGLSGFCGLAMVLAKMPWNRVSNNSCKSGSCCG